MNSDHSGDNLVMLSLYTYCNTQNYDKVYDNYEVYTSYEDYNPQVSIIIHVVTIMGCDQLCWFVIDYSHQDFFAMKAQCQLDRY
jgi:hypothetical protein